MKLLHYSAKTLGPLRDRTSELEPGHKPRGLWFSIEGKDDWKSWCEREEFALDRLAVTTEIILSPKANILHLRTAGQILKFTLSNAHNQTSPYYNDFTINWPKLGAIYDGIIIAPYCWSLRLDRRTRWYNGWDCASGCIWNPKAIESTKEL